MADKSEVAAYAEAHGLTYGGAWKRLNRERAKEFNRRDWKRPGRTEQKAKSAATAGAAACVDCGTLRASAKWQGHSRCDACERAAVQAAANVRRVEIERLWNEGLSIAEIAARLDSTPGSVGATVVRMRDAGWNVPLRHHGMFAERRAAA